MSLCWRGIDPLDSFHDQMVTIQQNEFRSSERTNFLKNYYSFILKLPEGKKLLELERSNDPKNI